MISPTPPDQKRGTYLLPVEDNRWIVTAGGWGADYPPADEEGFLKFIRELPIPDIYDIISTTEPLSDIFIYRFASNLRRLYERLKRFPAGYLVIGDAIASFNPVYGQGMTSAAMQAQSLDLMLSQGRSLDGVWRRFFSRVAQIINIPWQLAVGEDFRFRGTEGRKPLATDLINAYVAKVHLATQHDSVVYAQFLRVMNLMAPPTSLLHPRIVLRLLRN
jgi:2-polyprenyl-6-methoxyphenol hydroxylase-like FAD-dependent oxidoreductase